MIYIFVAIAIFVADFFIKSKVDRDEQLGRQRLILKDRIIIRKYYNKGAMLNFLEKWPKLLRIVCGLVMICVCIVFFAVLGKKGKAGLKLGLAMVIGGGASNLFDRLTQGHVIDYFSLNCKWERLRRIIFNISDWFIFLGTILVAIFHRE